MKRHMGLCLIGFLWHTIQGNQHETQRLILHIHTHATFSKRIQLASYVRQSLPITFNTSSWLRSSNISTSSSSSSSSADPLLPFAAYICSNVYLCVNEYVYLSVYVLVCVCVCRAVSAVQLCSSSVRTARDV